MIAEPLKKSKFDVLLHQNLQNKYETLLSDTRSELDSITQHLASNLLTPEEWAEKFAGILEDAHTQAVVLGRNKAGDYAAAEEDDKTFASKIMDEQAEYLDKFRQAISDGDGRYVGEDGLIDLDGVLNRADLYVARLTGTANEAFVLASDPDMKLYWELGGAELHCSRCPEIAAGSPYTSETIPSTPGSGGTPCLGRCKCYVRREDGVEGFKPVNETE